jgi:hypothetical protein
MRVSELLASTFELGAVFLLSVEAIKVDNVLRLIRVYRKALSWDIPFSSRSFRHWGRLVAFFILITFMIFMVRLIGYTWLPQAPFDMFALALLALAVFIAAVAIVFSALLLIVMLIDFLLSSIANNAPTGMTGLAGFAFYLISWTMKLHFSGG